MLGTAGIFGGAINGRSRSSHSLYGPGVEDNAYGCPTASKRWSLVRGDYKFENEFRLTERAKMA